MLLTLSGAGPGTAHILTGTYAGDCDRVYTECAAFDGDYLLVRGSECYYTFQQYDVVPYCCNALALNLEPYEFCDDLNFELTLTFYDDLGIWEAVLQHGSVLSYARYQSEINPGCELDVPIVLSVVERYTSGYICNWGDTITITPFLVP